MKSCPSENELASVVVGGSNAATARRIIGHVAKCKTCRASWERLTGAKDLLSLASVGKSGNPTFRLPRPSQRMRAEIKKNAMTRFDQVEALRKTLRVLIASNASPPAVKSDGTADLPEAVGYYATLPKTRERRIAAVEESLEQAMLDIFQGLLDPGVPIARRLALAKKMAATLGARKSRGRPS
jgi:hypothetical protein